jgi:hypothetical protein
MIPNKGYYSLIQFCPDRSRAEAVNLGVALFCPSVKFIGALFAQGNRRAAKLVGYENVHRTALNGAKRAIERRLVIDRDRFESLDDFQQFIDSRANILRMTDPRPVKVMDPAKDLESLFAELVDGVVHRSQRRPEVPALDKVFRKLEEQGKAKLDVTVKVPVIGRSLHVPYSYCNHVPRLVLPHRFSQLEGQALQSAMRLAIEGDLLHRHGINGANEAKLIVVPLFQASNRVQESSPLEKRVLDVLGEYQVETVPMVQVDAFAKRVEDEAH